MEPSKTFIDDSGNTTINNKAYEKTIQGLNRKFWELVIQGGISYNEASQMTTDDLLEAHSAMVIFDREAKEEMPN